MRYWMAPLWHNDPDALMVRRQTEWIRGLDLSYGLLTDDEARVSALNQYIGGGMVCFTEPMAEIDRDRLGLLRHCSPALGIAAIPRDMLTGKRYPEWFDVEFDGRNHGLGQWHTVSTVNWGDEARQATLELNEELLGSFAAAFDRFIVADFWSGRIWRGLARGAVVDLGELKPHACHHVKIIPEPNNAPCVLYTDGHFSMGGQEIESLTMDSHRVELQVDWTWEEPLRLILVAPKGRSWAAIQPSGKATVRDDRELLDWTTDGKIQGKVVFELE
jgi:hypothetical protein